MLQEIDFSNWQFWVILAVTVMICIAPVIFYFNAHSLFFPSLKDLILQGKVKPEILEEADPKRAKAAMEMLRK